MSMFLARFFHRQLIHTPPEPSASFEGKTVIVTGASSGLGLEACRSIVQKGASKVVLACRNLDKGHAAAQSIQHTTGCGKDVLDVWHLDMSSYSSVMEFAERAKSQLPRLDALLCNAGIQTTFFRLTEDNEETITTNVVSTSLVAFLLHPKLSETATKFNVETHITVTGSELHEMAKFQEGSAPSGGIFAALRDEKRSNMLDRYNVSKLLEIFVVQQMASISPVGSSGVIVNVVAPGFCQSELGRDRTGRFMMVFTKLFARTTDVGARTLVYGASAGPETHGQYVPDCVVTNSRGLSAGKRGAELQQKVWAELSEKLEAIRKGTTMMSLSH